jgi:hypothetical protein
MSDVPGALGLTPGQTISVLGTAGLAPSLHNIQPWSFRIGPDVIELYTDPSRRLPAADPQDRELRIACGAALFNLRLALQGQAIRPIVTVFPDRAQPGLVATVRRGWKRPPTPEIERLLRAVPRRHTNRMPFSEVPVTTPEQQELRRAATLEGGWLHLVLDRGQRATLSRLAQRAHRTQMSDPAFRPNSPGGPPWPTAGPTGCRRPRAARCLPHKTGGSCGISPVGPDAIASPARTSRTNP